MKKRLILLSVSLLLTFVLSGCFTQESTIKINLGGSVKVETEMLGTPEGISTAFGVASFEENIDTFIESHTDYIESNPEDIKSLTLEEVNRDIDGVTYQGIHAVMGYNSVGQMLASGVFSNLTQGLPIVNYSGVPSGIYMTEKPSMFGVTYSGKGDITISDQGMGAEGLENASISQTFVFPSLFVKSNATEKSALGMGHTWKASYNTPAEVSFSAFVPNPALVVATILIVLLAVWVALLLAAQKKTVIVAVEDDLEGEGVLPEQISIDELSEEYENGIDFDDEVEEVLPEDEPPSDDEEEDSEE